MAMPVVDKTPLNSDEPFDVWEYAKPGKPLFVENFGQLARAVEEGMKVEVYHIPVTNTFSLQAMADMGVERVWLSPELTLAQIETLGEQTPVALGLTVSSPSRAYDHRTLPFDEPGPCDQRCGNARVAKALISWKIAKAISSRWSPIRAEEAISTTRSSSMRRISPAS